MCIIKTKSLKEDHHIKNTLPLFQRLSFPLEQYVSINPSRPEMNYITEPNNIIIQLGGHAMSNIEKLDAVLAPSFKGEKCSKPQHHLKTFRSKASNFGPGKSRDSSIAFLKQNSQCHSNSVKNQSIVY